MFKIQQLQLQVQLLPVVVRLGCSLFAVGATGPGNSNIKRLPYPSQASHCATCVLERVHCNICGPLPPCYGAFHYFILFICCHSCYIFVSLMKTCEEAPEHFLQFKSLAKTFSQQKLSLLHINNAPELIRGKFEQYCKASGITYEKTVPDSPSQNGVAEHYNLTLVSMARALLHDAELSEWFWPFAILTTVHLKNWVPHTNLPSDKTPFELWYHYKPNLSHLCLFGAPCTSHILSNMPSKFAARGESGCFLGYAQDAKGYHVWIPNPNGPGGTLKTHRDVIFHDFPSSTPPNHPLPLWDEITTPTLTADSDNAYVLQRRKHILSLTLRSFAQQTYTIRHSHPCKCASHTYKRGGYRWR